jgi:hypothetical protein
MLRGPNASQPVHFLSGEPPPVRAAIRTDDGSRDGPGDINATLILEVRLSSEALVRARRAIDRLRRRRPSVRVSGRSAKPGTSHSPASREFLDFEQGAGV